MHQNIATRPTQIVEVIPLSPIAEGHHHASGSGAGGIWFHCSTVTARGNLSSSHPIVWHFPWPECVMSRLVTDSNPRSTITNSDLELAGGLIHLNAIANCFDIRKRTVLFKGDNLSTTFWECKGSMSSLAPPAYLLRLFGIHQHIHCYIPRLDYISGPSNHVADALSRHFDMTWPHLLSSLAPYIPQLDGCQIWTPSKHIVSAVTSALLRKPSSRESLLAVLPAEPQPGANGSTSPVIWASTPFSKPSMTKYRSYKSLHSEYTVANLQPAAIPSGLDWLRIRAALRKLENFCALCTLACSDSLFSEI
jgi:hypothetical protein